VFCQLKSFRNPHALHPKDFSLGTGGEEEFVTAFPRDLLVDEKVLKFYRAGHSDGVKSVASPPMPQSEARTDFVRVKVFIAGFAE
jgi:hypothetical protein